MFCVLGSDTHSPQNKSPRHVLLPPLPGIKSWTPGCPCLTLTSPAPHRQRGPNRSPVPSASGTLPPGPPKCGPADGGDAGGEHPPHILLPSSPDPAPTPSLARSPRGAGPTPPPPLTPEQQDPPPAHPPAPRSPRSSRTPSSASGAAPGGCILAAGPHRVYLPDGAGDTGSGVTQVSPEMASRRWRRKRLGWRFRRREGSPRPHLRALRLLRLETGSSVRILPPGRRSPVSGLSLPPSHRCRERDVCIRTGMCAFGRVCAFGQGCVHSERGVCIRTGV